MKVKSSWSIFSEFFSFYPFFTLYKYSLGKDFIFITVLSAISSAFLSILFYWKSVDGGFSRLFFVSFPIISQDKRARSLMILKLFLSIICRFKLISIEGKQWFIGNFSNFSKKIKRTFMRWGCFNIGYVSINGENFSLIKWQMYDHLKKKWNEF